jgi:hypothetical protein
MRPPWGPSGMRRGPLTVPLVLLVILLGACVSRGATGADPGPTSSAPSGTASGGTTGPAPGATSAPTPNPTPNPTGAPTASPTGGTPGALPGPVTVRRGGGIAGLQDTVVVAPDGAWRRTSTGGRGTGSGRLAADDLAKLRALVADPRLAGEGGRTPDPGRCADGFDYSVAVGATTVRYLECGQASTRPAVASAVVRLVLAAARD